MTSLSRRRGSRGQHAIVIRRDTARTGAIPAEAVFIDIFYQAQRDDPTIDRLVSQICALHDSGIAVKLATVRDSHGQFRLRPELEEVAGRCFEKVSVRYMPDEIDHIAWNYPLSTPQGANSGTDSAHAAVLSEHGKPQEKDSSLRSAALAMAAVGGGPLPSGLHPISLTWGLTPNRSSLGPRPTDGPQQPYCRSDHSGWELLPLGLRKLAFGDTSQPVCVFHETLRARDLTQTTPEEDQRLRSALKGKYVVLGLALSGSNDQVLSPIHGRIPGLYLHAMALDNLLTFGAHTPVDMHLTDSGSGPAWLFLLLALLILILFLHLVLPMFHTRASRPDVTHNTSQSARRFQFGAALRFLVTCALKLAGSIALGCLMLWVGQRALGIGFLSIIGIVFLTVVAEWTEFNEKLLQHFYPEATEIDQPR